MLISIQLMPQLIVLGVLRHTENIKYTIYICDFPASCRPTLCGEALSFCHVAMAYIVPGSSHLLSLSSSLGHPFEMLFG